jgi:hypothetical protein
MSTDHKHVWPISVAPLVALALLAGCGSDSSPTATQTSETDFGKVALAAYEIAWLPHDLAGIALSQIESLLGARNSGLGSPQDNSSRGALEEKYCTSGQIVITRDDKNGNGLLDAGEIAAIEFQDCVRDEVRLNGSMTISVNAPTRTEPTSMVLNRDSRVSDLSQFKHGALTYFYLLRIKSNLVLEGTSTVRGEMAMEIGIVDGVFSATISGSELSLSKLGSTYYLRDYVAGAYTMDKKSYPYRYPGYRGSYLYSIEGTASGGDLPGTVALSTPEPMVVSPMYDYPLAGQLKVVLTTDTGSSALLIEATKESNLNVYLDAIGDGIYEFYDIYDFKYYTLHNLDLRFLKKTPKATPCPASPCEFYDYIGLPARDYWRFMFRTRAKYGKK